MVAANWLVVAVLLVGSYCVLRLLLAGDHDLAVVAAISVATFVLDYWWRRQDETD